MKSFRLKGIRAIFNLQVEEEHAYCGSGICKDDGSFSYNQQLYGEHNIQIYYYPIVDYGSAPVSLLLDATRQMRLTLTYPESKIAVHCHAGLGRTGMLIACFLILNQGMSANDAIYIIRKTRPESIQSRIQIQAIKKFEHHVRWTFEHLFPFGEPHRHSLQRMMQVQMIRFANKDDTPLIPTICSERLLYLCDISVQESDREYAAYNSDRIKETLTRLLKFHIDSEGDYRKLIQWQSNLNSEYDLEYIDELRKVRDKHLLCDLFISWFGNLGKPILSKKVVMRINKKWSEGSKWSFRRFSLSDHQESCVDIIVQLFSMLLLATNSRKFSGKIVERIYCLLTLTHNQAHVDGCAQWPLMHQLLQPYSLKTRSTFQSAIKHWLISR
ncbi:hypothetical protein GJ496_000390 [Pomphorhynchus laevis]|nr:hypothetical protein GJ496_000390 [Pomphorhynchus laevis]